MPEKASDEAIKAVMDAMTVALKEMGWSPVVGGPVKIVQEPSAQAGHFRFVIEFTGTPPSDSSRAWV